MKPMQKALNFFKKVKDKASNDPFLYVGGALTGFVLIIAIFGPFIIPYGPTEMDISSRFEGPSLNHFFGADRYGRDIFSRVILGSRTALLLGVGATMFGLILGIPVGLFTGYVGGALDELIMRLMDTLMSFPSLLLALLVLMSLGSNIINVIISVGIVYMPRIARVTRSVVLSLKNEEFILAAKARGESDLYIIFFEIFPNTLSAILVEGTIRIGFAMLVGASLSFLGMGAQPPTPDWGLMIKQAKGYMFESPSSIIFPSIALGISIMGFNLLGDGLRKFLEPRTMD